MASSSSSINMIPHIMHDVFLSFRGEDVRHNFISHLNAALCRKKIATFIDDKLNRGDEISPSLSSAIEGSKISIVIFSEGYASSRWCLNELVKILESKNKYGQIVVPVFYRVDPSDVRNQTGTFGDSFSKLEERFKEKIDMVQTWRIVMREAANLSGFDSHVIRSESVLIERIVNDSLKKLNDLFPSDNTNQLVGVESIIKVLKVSYDALDDEEQNIFLDIACFFIGEHRDLVMNFLDACGSSAKIGICALVEKSLVTISNNKIIMHDLLQKMGREIVRQESIKDPGRRSRLWNHEDIYQVFNKNTVSPMH